jgi:hypothetical protein
MFEMMELLLTLSLSKPRYNVKAVLKECELFVYGDAYYIAILFCVNVLKFATSLPAYFFSMPPHVPYGLRGLPSRLWLKCN